MKSHHETMGLTEDDFFPDHLTKRPAGEAIDHVDIARESFASQLDLTTAALKIVDLRMEATEEEIARLRRQQAEDRREAAALAVAQRAARTALATLDGVDG